MESTRKPSAQRILVIDDEQMVTGLLKRNESSEDLALANHHRGHRPKLVRRMVGVVELVYRLSVQTRLV